MHLPIMVIIWSPSFFDGKEQKLGAGYLVTATERGNNRAGESLVEFALKNNDAGVKVYRTAAEYCDRAIASATDSYLRTQYVQKKGMLKYKLRQHRTWKQLCISGSGIFDNRSSIAHDSISGFVS